jgi:hypothetical protein
MIVGTLDFLRGPVGFLPPRYMASPPLCVCIYVCVLGWIEHDFFLELREA